MAALLGPIEQNPRSPAYAKFLTVWPQFIFQFSVSNFPQMNLLLSLDQQIFIKGQLQTRRWAGSLRCRYALKSTLSVPMELTMGRRRKTPHDRQSKYYDVLFNWEWYCPPSDR